MSDLSRRALTATALVAGVSTATLASAGTADAATSWAPSPYAKTPLPSAKARHYANRFSAGWTPKLQREIDAAGGPAPWFERQLNPGSISDAFYSTSSLYWPSNNLSGKAVALRHDAGVENIWTACLNYQRWSMLRRMYGGRHLLEQMAAFWEHHFNVPAIGDTQGVFRAAYGKALRQQALGRFADLLFTATTHPAMGCYLGNASSTAKAPNENLGRELLELHTVGRTAGYTETDVKNSARILTGYRVDVRQTWQAGYDEASHWVGPVKVLGFSDPNASTNGQPVLKRYLDYLARHPSTARMIARKLATRFVSDVPSADLVAELARVYLANDTNIIPVLRALVASSEFQQSAGQKVRTAEEDVIATYRVLGVRVGPPTTADSTANAMLWQAGKVGLYPYAWPRPDGRPDSGGAWSATSRLLASFEVHYAMAGGWWPKRDATYRTAVSWLPEPIIRMDLFVDHLSRTILGRASTATLLRACCQVTDTARTEKISKDHKIIKWKMARLLTTFLDNPQHLGR